MRLSAIGSGNDRRDDSLAAHGLEGCPRPPAPRDLEAVKRNFPGYPYPDLLRAIEVSVEELKSADREQYLDLAVFPEDQPIPEEKLRVLWNLE
jgi:hypothetical protein